jgi:hypothetical protein
MESSDCDSNFCKGNRCAEPTCSDGIKNQDETGVDCGGASCEGCADGEGCRVASDCQSSLCSEKQCESGTCSDQIRNQDESDTDCGGACEPCPEAARCNEAADCESWICSDAGECSADIVIPAADVIDDFEDADLLLPASPPLGGRIGSWYAYGDGSGISTLEVFAIEHGPTNANGLRTSGSDFSNWGSGFGVDLNNPGGGAESKLPYDAAAYAGITFRARAESPMKLTVVIPDGDTDPAGNICTTCDHHYRKSLKVTTSWQRFTVAFSELMLEPGSVPAPAAFDPSRVFSVRFLVAPGQAYEIAVDDIAFVED